MIETITLPPGPGGLFGVSAPDANLIELRRKNPKAFKVRVVELQKHGAEKLAIKFARGVPPLPEQ
jgi:hypothetical protein